MIPTVNVTGTVYDHNGAPVAGAQIKVRLSKTDLYQHQYIYPEEKTYTAGADGTFTLPLFPNAIGELNTYYNIKAQSADGGTTYVRTTAVVPNFNTTLDEIALTGAGTPLNAYSPGGYPTNIPFYDQALKFVSTLKNFNTSARSYIFPDVSGTVMILAGVLSAGLVFAQPDGSFVSRTLLGTANQITVTNGDGVAGNPTISLPATINVATSVVTPLVETISVHSAAGVQLDVLAGSGQNLILGSNGVLRWFISAGGSFAPISGQQNLIDIGAPGAEVRSGYF
jgi:hypothetical protein